jgi:uncharacterized protein YodC (DUF2158 family)
MIEFQPGDIVRLKSGSPRMIVTAVSDDTLSVMWCSYETKTIQKDYIPRVALVKAS